MKKDLIVFVAHIDDFECACYGYVFKHHKEYDKIKIITHHEIIVNFNRLSNWSKRNIR